MTGTQRRVLVSPRGMQCKYCGMPKGTSQAEATSNSKKNEYVPFELCCFEGIRQAGRQAVS